jgi:hypothetical protein
LSKMYVSVGENVLRKKFCGGARLRVYVRLC